MKPYVAKNQQEPLHYMYKANFELAILIASRCLHGDDVREHTFAELVSEFWMKDRRLLWSRQYVARFFYNDVRIPYDWIDRIS